MAFRTFLALLVLACARAFAASPADTPPPPTVATAYTFSPYMDGQVGNTTGAGPEGRPTAADGWTGNGTSSLVLSPVGDGTLIMVFAQINLVTDDLTAIPNPGRTYDMMLVAGLPPLDVSVVAKTAQFGFSGNFQGFQVDSGAVGPNFSMDGTSALNDSSGSRWYVVCSFFNGPPFNAMWAADDYDSFPHQCWLADKDPTTGKTPFRVRGSLWYLTSWAAISPWLQSQEALKLVKQVNPAPSP